MVGEIEFPYGFAAGRRQAVLKTALPCQVKLVKLSRFSSDVLTCYNITGPLWLLITPVIH